MALAESHPSLDEILGRSLERARWYNAESVEERFAYRLVRVSDKLNGDGEVSESETLEYAVEPLPEYPGYSFDRLVGKNGQPLSDKEVPEQERRLENLLRKLAKGNEKKDPDEDRIEYDEKLLARYRFELVGLRRDRGRTAYLITFEPKSDDLPVEKRIDRALNKAVGEIWIDSETFEVARVNFHLTEKVKIGWGLVGSIGEVTGEIQRRPVDGEIWLPDEMQFLIKGRVLFSSLHRRERMTWSDFRNVLGVPTEDSAEVSSTAER